MEGNTKTMVSVEQITTLIEFAEEHPVLMNSNSSRTMEGRTMLNELWIKCAEKLNQITPGVKKKPRNWRTYFNEYKSKLLKKIKAAKEEDIVKAGGGDSSQYYALTPLQARFYASMGRDFGEEEPCDISQLEDDYLPASTSNIIDVPKNEKTEEKEKSNAKVAIRLESFEVEWDESAILEEPEKHPKPTNLTVPEQVPDEGQESQSEPADSAGQQPPRKKRRRRQKNTEQEQKNNTEQNVARDFTDILHNMEQLNAEATRAHAEATNRLAAAIESLSERLRDPIVVVVQQTSRRRSEVQEEVEGEEEGDQEGDPLN